MADKQRKKVRLERIGITLEVVPHAVLGQELVEVRRGDELICTLILKPEELKLMSKWIAGPPRYTPGVYAEGAEPGWVSIPIDRMRG